MDQRVIVCGGRDYMDREHLFDILDTAHFANPIVLLIHGNATGADMLANDWAGLKGVCVKKFPADWETYGRSAGPRRNRKMIDEGKPDIVIAFPGGKGTRNMIEQAEGAGLPVVKIRAHAKSTKDSPNA